MSPAKTILNRALPLAGAVALALIGCGGEKKDEATGEQPAATAKPKAEPGTADKPKAPKEPAAIAPKVDETIMAELKKITEACTVDPSGVTVTKCKDKEARTFTDSFRKRDRAAALDTFTAAYTSSDAKLKTAAVNLSGNALSNLGDDAKVPVDVAKRHVAAVGALEKYHAAQSVRSAVHAAMTAGIQDELFAMLDGHSYAPVRSIGYRETMTRGRLKPLAKLKELANGSDAKVAAAAINAPRRMYKATEAEKAAVCPWIVEHLKKAEGPMLKEAGHSAVWCGGDVIDTLLDVGEKRLAEDKFDRDSYLVYRDICFTPIGNEVPGKAEQCDRNYKFLESAVKNKKLEGRDRGLALFAIYYQRRDAKSMKVMKKYRKSKVPEIKKYAEDAIKSLKETYKVK